MFWLLDNLIIKNLPQSFKRHVCYWCTGSQVKVPEFGTELAKASTCTEKWKKEKINKQTSKNTSLVYHTRFSLNICVYIRTIKFTPNKGSYKSQDLSHWGRGQCHLQRIKKAVLHMRLSMRGRRGYSPGNVSNY